jgi:hypothetical protein
MGEFIMNILRNIALFTMLLGTIGNSWATGNLQMVRIPPGGELELIFFVTPDIIDPIPAVCEKVDVTPVIAHFESDSTIAGMNGFSVVNGEISVEVGSTVTTSPGEYVGFSYSSSGLDMMDVGVELIMTPEDAINKCGPKASVSVTTSNGELIGTPVMLDEAAIKIPAMKVLKFRVAN